MNALPGRWSLKLWSIWWPNTSAAPLRMVSPRGLAFLLTLATAFHLAVTFHYRLGLRRQSGSWRAPRSSLAAAILSVCFFFNLFFMTTQINLMPLSQIPLGLQTGWQYGSQYRRVSWQGATAFLLKRKRHFDVSFIFSNSCNSFSATQIQHSL